MTETTIFAPEGVALALSLPVIYAAWHEYSARNVRDARLLAGVGVGGLLLSAAGFAL